MFCIVDQGAKDVELFMLTPDHQALTVKIKWLEHLQQRLMGESWLLKELGAGEDPCSSGLVLEWLYGILGAKKVGVQQLPRIQGHIAQHTICQLSLVSAILVQSVQAAASTLSIVSISHRPIVLMTKTI